MPSDSRSAASSAAQEQAPSGGGCVRPASLLTYCFLLLAAVALAYVAGVMSGRAYSGSASKARLAHQALPQEEMQPEEIMAATVEAILAGATAGQRILAAEELHFASVLRGVPGEGAHATAPVSHGLAEARPAEPAQPAPAAMQPAAMQPAVLPGQTPTPQPKALLFDYVFQVGAFKDGDSVDALRQRLEGRGLRTRMKRDGKLYLVLVLLRGDAARATEVKRTLEELRLGAPMELSRKPAVS